MLSLSLNPALLVNALSFTYSRCISNPSSKKICFLSAGTGVDAFLKFALPLSHDIPKVAGEKRTNE